MGNLIVSKVTYLGSNYYYESPKLSSGINIIVGDNGSGKSTFSYFVEYGLGGSVKPFKEGRSGGRYLKILNDENNYVLLDVSINDVNYQLKRFINHSDILVKEGQTIQTLPISRTKEIKYVFSDWLLDKLGIPVFELNLGAINWKFGFNDLYRLLNYDQDTEANKIFKSPSSDNFVSDSVVIRKSIFEILLGLSSSDYFKSLDELKLATKEKDDAKSLWDNFLSRYGGQIEDLDTLKREKEGLQIQLSKLIHTRNNYLKSSTSIDDKLGELSNIQNTLVQLELSLSEKKIKTLNFKQESGKIDKLFQSNISEISQIEKIIFTHEKLDLFSMQLCPFCMSDKSDRVAGHCICGSEFKEDDYEKFVYNSSEYKQILQHKQKSIESIEKAKESYEEEINKLEKEIQQLSSEIEHLTTKMSSIIKTAEFSGNSIFIDDLNDQIIKVKDALLKKDSQLEISVENNKLEKQNVAKKLTYTNKLNSFNKIEKLYKKNNLKTIEEFNSIYGQLLAESSYESDSAYIDEDYMPIINDAEYREKSSEVPKRLMYYFTILSLALKFDSIKHPRFLLIDTPEDSGIDTAHLKQNLALLSMALDLSKKNQSDHIKDYQVILTTGYGKLPDEYEPYVIERFNKKQGDFILKKRN